MLGRTVFWRALALGAHIGAPLQFCLNYDLFDFRDGIPRVCL